LGGQFAAVDDGDAVVSFFTDADALGAGGFDFQHRALMSKQDAVR